MLSKITENVKDMDPKAEIIIFGSHARGDAHSDSDWDVIILLDADHVSKKTAADFRHHLFDLEIEMGQPISTFVYSKNEWEDKFSITSFYQNIKKEGIFIQ